MSEAMRREEVLAGAISPVALEGASIDEAVIEMQSLGKTWVSYTAVRERDGMAVDLKEAHYALSAPEHWQEHRAYRQKLVDLWAKPNALKESAKVPTLLYGKAGDGVSPLAIDHTRSWVSNRVVVCVSTQPYQISIEQLIDLREFLNEEGLEGYFHCGAETWFPANCLALVFIVEGSIKRIPTLLESVKQRRSA